MQKLILLFSVLNFTFIYSQEVSSISADAVVNLVYPISLKSGTGDLDFGEIILTGMPIIEKIKPKEGKEFIIQGQKGRNVTIYFNKVILNNYEWAAKFNGKLGRLLFSPKVVNKNNKVLESGSNIVLKSNDAIGEQQIYVGGKIRIKARQPIGNYRGIFIISVAY